jgi:hypothetical protein
LYGPEGKSRMTNLMTGNVLGQASREWATRPDDQRFLTMDELRDSVEQRRKESWTLASGVKNLRAQAVEDRGLVIDAYDPTAGETRSLEPTNFAFGQLAQYASAPAAYLRKLPTQLAAINLQWGIENMPIREDVLVLAQTNGSHSLRAMTSTSYGRIWDGEVVQAVERAIDGGTWTVPAASYTATNPRRATTLYASDRDVFLFLVDEQHPIEVNGEVLFRGFMVWNSEVGAATFGITTFLYRYVCDNRMIWGATDVQELRIRHTGGAPDRFGYEGAQYLERYANESTAQITEAVTKAQQFEVPRREGEKAEDAWGTFLMRNGFTSNQARNAVNSAVAEEGEVRSLWDIINGVTASARSITHTDERVNLEKRAGRLMERVAS